MILNRLSRNSDGIFGALITNDPKIHWLTLEHAYLDSNQKTYSPKIPQGKYVCMRGVHQLLGMSNPMETFEITHVPGHIDLLFHVGNFNEDSEGCVLLGNQIVTRGKFKMLMNSKISFNQFMKYLKGIKKFELTIVDSYSV